MKEKIYKIAVYSLLILGILALSGIGLIALCVYITSSLIGLLTKKLRGNLENAK